MDYGNEQYSNVTPQIIDSFTWEKNNKIITSDVHRISGLGNFTYFCNSVSRAATPAHYHENLMEIHCIVKGRRDSYIHRENKPTEVHVSMGNEALIMFPGEVHSSGKIVQDPCEAYALQLDMSFSKEFLGLSERIGHELRKRLTEIKNRKVRIEPFILGLLKRAFEKMASGKYEAGVAYIICFLYEFTEAADSQENPEKNDERIERALNYINENIYETIQLSDLAKLSGYSLSRFKSRFREVTGRTPGAYINAAKVAEAKNLLAKNKGSVTEIALNLGWSSSNYFCSVFRKLTGISPLQYRKRAGKQEE